MTQTVTTGVGPAPLLEFAAAVRQVLPVSGLPADEQAQLVEQAQELESEANGPAPTKGNARHLVDALMAGLAKAATPVTTAILNTLGNDAVRALGGH